MSDVLAHAIYDAYTKYLLSERRELLFAPDRIQSRTLCHILQMFGHGEKIQIVCFHQPDANRESV